MTSSGIVTKPSLFQFHILCAILLMIAWSLAFILLARHLVTTWIECQLPPELGHLTEADLSVDGIKHHIDDLGQTISDLQSDYRTASDALINQKALHVTEDQTREQIVSEANQRHFSGTGPFDEPAEPPWYSYEFYVDWWKEIHKHWVELNHRYDEVAHDLAVCDQAIATLATMRDKIARQRDDLTDQLQLWLKWQDSPFKRACAVDTIRGSPWTKVAIIALHAPFLPLSLLLAIQSMLRVVLLLERLPAVRLVVRQ